MGPTKDGITPYIYMNVLPLDDTNFVNHMINRINNISSLHDEGKIDLKTQYIGNFMEGDYYELIAVQSVTNDITGNAYCKRKKTVRSKF